MSNGEMLSVLERIIDGEDVFGEEMSAKAISLMTLAGLQDVLRETSRNREIARKENEAIREELKTAAEGLENAANQLTKLTGKSNKNEQEIQRLRDKSDRMDQLLGVILILGTIANTVLNLFVQ